MAKSKKKTPTGEHLEVFFKGIREHADERRKQTEQWNTDNPPTFEAAIKFPDSEEPQMYGFWKNEGGVYAAPKNKSGYQPNQLVFYPSELIEVLSGLIWSES